MTTTPTTRTSSHFSIGRSLARVATPLERDSDLPDAGNMAELRHRQAHPRRLELPGHERAHVLGQGLEELEAALCELGGDAAHDFAVMDRVVDVVGAADLVAGNADLDVHLERLRALLLPLVDAHPGVDTELPDEDR